MVQNKKKTPISGYKKKILIASLSIVVSFLLFSGSLYYYGKYRLENKKLTPLSTAENDIARSVWYKNYQNDAEAEGLSKLKYSLSVNLQESAQILSNSLHAISAILVDAQTGAIIFQKNENELIPPASMTKLVGMFVAFKAIAYGDAHLDDLVDLPPESWAQNIPAGSSLMFLSQGHIVSLRELLIGMAVPSGNDAAIAVAYHIAGSVPAFVERMNQEVQNLNLNNTIFVEPSGLSEYNLTSAKEFARFTQEYCKLFPDALHDFNAIKEIAYPLEKNLPAGRRETPVYQKATNIQLLDTLEGCDGLKTGFIYESGFNLALTATRGGTRFISITMGGPWQNTSDGVKKRNTDGKNLIDWAFEHFKTVSLSEISAIPLSVWGGTAQSLFAIPVAQPQFTSDQVHGDDTIYELIVNVPKSLTAPIFAGEQIGSIDYYFENQLYHSVPMISDRNIFNGSKIQAIRDRLAIALLDL